tara:strand:+ start:203 stop:514 length:312 start_codon:yes stop_codon:yes gene_type:complete
MKIFKVETDRVYDNKEQTINVMLKDNVGYDDRFLDHDIVFVDSVRNIVGTIDFDSGMDREDFFILMPNREYWADFILGAYDNGEYKIGTAKDIEQLRYYAARY